MSENDADIYYRASLLERRGPEMVQRYLQQLRLPRPQHLHSTWRFGRRERHRLWVCCPTQARVRGLRLYHHHTNGPFTNDDPECYEEVLQEEIKPIPGAWLKKELGQ